jgi:NAD(P)-dependent dehydrogenase (short-subunit alcohol dehydrogenase family)
MHIDLTGRRTLITAGAAGIGREFARAFERAGARVFVCDIDRAALAILAADAPRMTTEPCDVSDRTAVERMVAACADRLGGIDILVNNAGIGGPTHPVEGLDPAEWEKTIEVDLNGAFYVTRAAIPHLKRSEAGVILNMSSVAGRFGYPNRSAYAAAKWGLVGFTKTLSIELGAHGIRVNAILPGVVEGERIERVFEGRARVSGRSVEEVRAEAMRVQSIKRLVDPRDIAALGVFLSSDYAQSISGQALSIDNDAQQL